MNKVLDNKYPYLMNFFDTAIKQNRLFHSIILHGSNRYLQYAVALELARKLNCLEDGKDDCNCQNCRWIRDNKHPAIMTISRIDNKNDTSHTVISRKQVNDILDSLITSSDYHRVLIFCDAEMKHLKQEEMVEYQEFKTIEFKTPQEEDEGKVWYPSGINHTCFHSEAANAMLKSIEEPSSKVTFIFLTNNKDDLLQTIVSRSQAFCVPDYKTLTYEVEFLTKYFSSYPNFNKDNALDFAQALYNYQQRSGAQQKPHPSNHR